MTNIICDHEQAKKTAIELGLISEEYDKIVDILGGRVPTYTELGVYSVMWSEHCSYKNSILELKKLPKKGKNLLVEAGEENAGLVDIGNGLAVAFKIESHNHPSAIVPYEGAATGVGGILRDIFTMGARPIAALNSLRFGALDNEKTKYLLRGVVHGISDYGNSFGVPTVAGDVYFDPSYQGNPLVNAMAVGIVEHGKTVSATAAGVGNAVMIVGSSTGRDGIHGASLLASAVFAEGSEELRPTVQVGDPFTEKLLLEASLEAIDKGLVVGMQDMGAAGISCSTSEMSFKAGTGMDVDLDKVPLREASMSAYEIMLSESQERMLVVVEPKNIEAIKEVFDKWDLHAVVIGIVTDTGNVVVRHHGDIVANIPAKSLALGGDMTPVYVREQKKPAYLSETSAFKASSLSDVKDPGLVLKALLSSPNISSKHWVYEQYDSMVRTNTLDLEGSDAAIVRVKGTKKGIAVKTDCNGRFVYLNPYLGGMIAVAEAARNVVCVGAKPIAITNCLNFGNPYDPEVYYQFVEALKGMSDGCIALETPVTGGNVSFYNESPDSAVFPTPMIGMLGIIDDISKCISVGFKEEGDSILLLTAYRSEDETDGLGGSEYLSFLQNGKALGDAPYCDAKREKDLVDTLLELTDKKLIASAHDVSDGGLAVALAECAFEKMLGFTAMIDIEKRKDVALFGEAQGRIVISAPQKNISAIRSAAKARNIECEQIGIAGGTNFVINDLIDVPLAELREAYMNTIPEAMMTVTD
jgi:phosphoribosylformylglycinamidine synthase